MNQEESFQVGFIYNKIQPFLFRQDPEVIHERTIWGIQKILKIPGMVDLIERFYDFDDPILSIQCLGNKFPNPIGMAAGFDKNGKVYNPLFSLGFGFVEIGTVTPLAQPGNPKPRMFRLPEDQGIINRLGFNNQGVEALVKQVQQSPPKGILGINIGKNKVTPLEKAKDDYNQALKAVYDQADYIVVNVSSPNTEKLRALQEQDALRALLGGLLTIRKELITQGQPKKPLLLKIAPDLTEKMFHDIVTILQEFQLDGVIATNTTLRRENLKCTEMEQEEGGLSGAPLQLLSTEIIKKLFQALQGNITIIGVGGVFTGQDAYEKIRAGASLIQIYTSMIYRGPVVAKRIKQELSQLLKNDGFTSLREAIGIDCK